MQGSPPDDNRLAPTDQELDRALIQLTYLVHDLARIDSVAQYFVSVALSVLRDRRSASTGGKDEGSGPQ